MGDARNLVDATLQQLRDSECADLFGDTWDGASGIQKMGADYVGEVALPWLVIYEPGETYTYMSPGPGFNRPYLAEGTLQISVYSEDRQDARVLGNAVARTLNDVETFWTGGKWKMFRLASAGYQPAGMTGPAVPTLYHRVLSFSYAYQGVL